MPSGNRLESGSFNPDNLVRLKDVAKLARRVRHPDARNFLLRNLLGLEQIPSTSDSSEKSDNLKPIEGALDITNASNSNHLRVFRIINRIADLQKKAKQPSRPRSSGAEVAEAIDVALKSVGRPFNSLSLMEQQALLRDLQTAGISTHPDVKNYESRLAYLETQ